MSTLSQRALKIHETLLKDLQSFHPFGIEIMSTLSQRALKVHKTLLKDLQSFHPFGI